MHLALNNGPFVLHKLIPVHVSHVPLIKFQMPPRLTLLMSSGSSKKKLKYECLTEAKASHSHRMWTEDSSPVPRLKHKGLLVTPLSEYVFSGYYVQ